MFSNLIGRLHSIMANPTILQCQTHIEAGRCCCCEFTEDLGNWIGLIPGEKEYLQENVDCTGWDFINKDGIDGIICHRHGLNCGARPWDCAVYPAFPKRVTPYGASFCVDFIMGFPKCPLYDDTHFTNGFSEIQTGNGLLWKVGVCAIELHKADFDEWMLKTAEGFKGYNKEVKVIIPGAIKMPV